MCMHVLKSEDKSYQLLFDPWLIRPTILAQHTDYEIKVSKKRKRLTREDSIKLDVRPYSPKKKQLFH